MAKIRFLKPGKPSQKKDYIASGTKYKKILWAWRLTTISEALTIVCLIIKLKGHIF